MTNSNIQLYYFRGRGRAEPIRILLHYLQLSYRDIFIETHEAMQALQQQGLSPFKQLPILFMDDQYLVETPAILRYLARKYHLYGHADAEKYRCDMLAAASFDWQANYFKAIFNAEFAIDYRSILVKKYLNPLEKLLLTHRQPYFINQAPTFVDLLIFELILNHLDMLDHCLDKHPRLTIFSKTLSAMPALKAYLNSKDRMPFPTSTYTQTVHRILGRPS